ALPIDQILNVSAVFVNGIHRRPRWNVGMLYRQIYSPSYSSNCNANIAPPPPKKQNQYWLIIITPVDTVGKPRGEGREDRRGWGRGLSKGVWTTLGVVQGGGGQAVD